MLAPIAAVAALVFALILASGVKKQSPGNDRMKEISGAIKEGAQAFLKAEYKILVLFVLVLFVVIGLGIGKLDYSGMFLSGSCIFHYGRILRHAGSHRR